jgi:hypothetical protein
MVLVREIVSDGCPIEKSTIPLEFATTSIPLISKLFANFFASSRLSVG